MSGTKLATRKVAGNMMRSDFTAKKIYELLCGREEIPICPRNLTWQLKVGKYYNLLMCT